MSDHFKVTLPLPPSVNSLYQCRGKAMQKTPKCKAWFDEAGWRMNEARAGGRFKPLPPEVWYWTDVRLPENHLGDSDNRLKALHDLLHMMGATPDDRWLLGGTYMRCSDVVSGTCEVAAISVPQGIKTWNEEVQLLARQISGSSLVGHRGQIS
ncbi:hypothetical protein [Shimia sp.]|uniref:hypothetical protein n=1 Tax=Shimia sp. TaxID=1954381 RepID=UPI003BAC89E4